MKLGIQLVGGGKCSEMDRQKSMWKEVRRKYFLIMSQYKERFNEAKFNNDLAKRGLSKVVFKKTDPPPQFLEKSTKITNGVILDELDWSFTMVLPNAWTEDLL